MNRDEAKEVAARFIAENVPPPQGDNYLIVDAGIVEDPEGWYFPYQTARFIETRDIDYSVVGNWPVFVAKSGSVVELRRPVLPR